MTWPNHTGPRGRRLAPIGIPIEIDNETNAQAWNAAVALARRHRLTLYNAAYLELAVRRDLPLATFDDELVRSAVAEGVPLAAANVP